MRIIGGTLFDNVTLIMRIHQAEIFGPVLSIVRAARHENALKLVNGHDHGNASSLATPRDFTARMQAGMAGINVPIAGHSLGGLNQHGPDSIRFHTKTKPSSPAGPPPARTAPASSSAR